MTARWHLGARAATTALALVAALELWARFATDPDYYLPDFFRPVVLFVAVVFVLTGAIANTVARRVIRGFSAGAVVILLVLEARVRFRETNPVQRIERVSDVLLRYRYRPGADVGAMCGAAGRVNSLGLCDTEHTIPKPRDVYRVVVLTGSIANDAAVPFDQRFFRVLERELAGRVPDGRRVEVVNVSCEGYNTVQQVRALEQVGLQYEPDFVVLAYMLTSSFVQDGGYRRLGNSFFAFRFMPPFERARTGSICSVFAPYHDRYSFDLIVRNSFERLVLLQRLNHFGALVAVLPVVEHFDDPTCQRLYDRVAATARQSGLPALRVVDAFRGENYVRYQKPDAPYDVAHPTAGGHARIGRAIAEAMRTLVAR